VCVCVNGGVAGGGVVVRWHSLTGKVKIKVEIKFKFSRRVILDFLWKKIFFPSMYVL